MTGSLRSTPYADLAPAMRAMDAFSAMDSLKIIVYRSAYCVVEIDGKSMTSELRVPDGTDLNLILRELSQYAG